MSCLICHLETASDKLCSRCGYPAVDGELAKEIASAAELLESGKTDAAIRKLQPMLRDKGSVFIVHLNLARAFARKGASGQAGFERLADREFSAAMQAIPRLEEAFLAALDVATVAGRLDEFVGMVDARFGDLPFAPVIRDCAALAKGKAERAARKVWDGDRPLLHGGRVLHGGSFPMWGKLLVLGGFTIIAGYTVSGVLATRGGGKGGACAAGENLLRNGDASAALEDWTVASGDVSVWRGDDPRFRLVHGKGVPSVLEQVVPLPGGRRPRYLLFLAKGMSEDAAWPGEHRFPTANVVVEGAKGRQIESWSTEHGPPWTRLGWGMHSAVMAVSGEAERVVVRLTMAIREDAPPSTEDWSVKFDDVQLRFFHSRVIADEYRTAYASDDLRDPTPDQIAWDAEAKPPRGLVELRRRLKDGWTASVAEDAVRQRYALLNPGISYTLAAEIMDAEWREGALLERKYAYLTLRAWAEDGRVVRVEMVRHPEHASPGETGRVEASKGAPRG